MTRIAITGASGFLGWHTRVAALSRGKVTMPVSLGDVFDLETSAIAFDESDALIHIAGVNRGTDAEIVEGNVRIAQQVAQALDRSTKPPKVIAFANSIQHGNGTAYGDSKAHASEVISKAAQRVGSFYRDLRLPNLFGEHGRPNYNSVTATFTYLLATGGTPKVEIDRELTLLHAQDAADLLLGFRDADAIFSLARRASVSEVLSRLSRISREYADGTIPDITERFDRDLFNTYRSVIQRDRARIVLARHEDHRGGFVEIVKAKGGQGQASYSTTLPGVVRGQHFHRRKIERFTVLEGDAVISMRRLFTPEVVDFHVDGKKPTSIDMPTGWAHSITNVGEKALLTHFWSNEIFDPSNPDTYAEAVHR